MRTVALLLLAGLALAAPAAPAMAPKKDPSKADLKRMQGWWLCTSCRCGADSQECAGVTVVIAGERLTAAPAAETYGVTLDARRRPRWVNLKARGKSRPRHLIGVYSLVGDTLTLCLVERAAGSLRPRGLAGGRPGEYHFVFKRRKR
jgi:uncharacterized protein (TIGR03067 family)